MNPSGFGGLGRFRVEDLCLGSAGRGEGGDV